MTELTDLRSNAFHRRTRLFIGDVVAKTSYATPITAQRSIQSRSSAYWAKC